jgi:hypothetical protein
MILVLIFTTSISSVLGGNNFCNQHVSVCEAMSTLIFIVIISHTPLSLYCHLTDAVITM